MSCEHLPSLAAPKPGEGGPLNFSHPVAVCAERSSSEDLNNNRAQHQASRPVPRRNLSSNIAESLYKSVPPNRASGQGCESRASSSSGESRDLSAATTTTWTDSLQVTYFQYYPHLIPQLIDKMYFQVPLRSDLCALFSWKSFAHNQFRTATSLFRWKSLIFNVFPKTYRGCGCPC
jgi:hypothetical protein